MSNTQAAIKVADQLISRLFNHKQFTTGEINYIIKEIGEKSNLEENFEKILKINQDICCVDDQSQLRVDQGATQSIFDDVSSLHEMIAKLLLNEETYRAKEDRMLEPLRKERETAKKEVQKEIVDKLEKNAEALMQEELELERKFVKFEENLRNSM